MDKGKAVQLWKGAAEGGSAAAQYVMGAVHADGGRTLAAACKKLESEMREVEVVPRNEGYGNPNPDNPKADPSPIRS